MSVVVGYQNIYRSGYYHRKGKPNAYDRHSGDIYPTEAAALAEIHPYSHYVATVAVMWVEAAKVKANPAESIPVSLTETRYEVPAFPLDKANNNLISHAY